MTSDVPTSRIDALVRLLGDEDPKILGVAWDHLERIGEPALPLLERAKRESPDGRVRVQSERFLTEWSRREVFRRWVDLCRGPEVGLEEGAFLIAESEYPAADLAPYRRMLDGYAGVLRHRLATARTTEEAVRKIAALLFHEVGLKGNAEEYSNPDNSYLNRVLDLKKGIPISLAAIFILVARRLSVPVQGVGMPQRFLVKFRGPAHELFVDPFGGGRLLTARDCAGILAEAEVPFRGEHLRGVSDREILTRMLGNLSRIYRSMKDRRRHERVAAMAKLLS
ncbi:MAG: hypothetical protein HY721_15835 [Planctomycetes bacterium]|nr:hypothetical protein [Planctomycetota bacterium]